MKIRKVLKAKVFSPTKHKLEAMDALWDEWKRALKLPRDYRLLRDSTDLPSFYCQTMSWKVAEDADAPIELPKSAFDLWVTKNFIFISIPTCEKGKRINLPLKIWGEHRRIIVEIANQSEYDSQIIHICDSQIVKKKGEYYLHLCIDKEVPDPIIPSHAPVLAIDIGERVIATSVMFDGYSISSPMFLGREVRGIRRHYAWLRKRLGEKKLMREIKRIGSTESRKVNDLLHKASSRIVQQAKEAGAVIAIGDLTNIRETTNLHNRGKRMKRIVNSMPFAILTNLIVYKSQWAGVPVIFVNEAYSSRTCHICNQDGTRPSQGRFVCSSCGEYNADLNGAINIAKRALSYMDIAGGHGFDPARCATI